MARTILVVEDEPTLRETLAESLEADGYRAVQAADGRVAMELFRADRPDLVLLDLMLPELSELEVTRQIRAESSIPIVMLTASDSEVDEVVGLELGADDYVTKPFSFRELSARVRAVLLGRVWGYDYPGETRTVDVHVHWLRSAVEQDPSNPTRIQTVRGVGYVLRRG